METRHGALRGSEDAHDTWVWRGIPFAEAPLGPLRWKAPRPVQPWSQVRDATRFGRLAMQAVRRDEHTRTSEDCLYLNVWRPRTSESGLPVYFWIHGGGNTVAMPTPAATPGTAVAGRSNVVFVSIHYRLGEFGWFTHPSLRSGKPGDELDDSGNYGTLDIIAALRWVQDNIEVFGGDPRRVFVTGESAGAYNALTLLLSPPAHGLFAGAMAQSGRQNIQSLEEGDERAQAVLRALIRDEGSARSDEDAQMQLEKFSAEETARYLRSKHFADFLRTRARVPFSGGAFRDGAVLHRDGFGALRQGTYPNKVPVIVGMNREEAKFQLSRTQAWERMDEETYQAVARYLSDLKKATGADDVLRALASHPDQPPVYGYLMSWGACDAQGHSPAPEPIASRVGACHGIDIPFFFGRFERPAADLGGVTATGFTDANLAGRLALSDAMMRYAAEFARKGEPNPASGELPVWRPWSAAAGAEKAIVFNADCEAARIAMNREELREAEIHASLNALPAPLREKVVALTASARR